MNKKIRIICVLLILVLAFSMTGCGLWGLFDEYNEPRSIHTLAQSVNMLKNSGVSVNTVNNATDNPMSVSQVVEKVADSVVEINTVISANEGAAGSGVLFATNDTRYFIITNHHVVEDAVSINVTLTDGSVHVASLVASDKKTDIAVITITKRSIDTTKYKTVTVPSDNYKLRVGDTAIAIGNPLGELGGTVTSGIVSALERQVILEDQEMTLLQTDAAINSGNSGGALFDAYGQLIGIVNAKAADVGIEGIGFAIPVKTAVSVACDLIINGKITTRPVIGVTIVGFASVDQIDNFSAQYNWQDYFNYTDKAIGLYVYEVSNTASGLQVGDYIMSADGSTVRTQAELSRAINAHKVGDVLQLVVKRRGEIVNLSVTLIDGV